MDELTALIAKVKEDNPDFGEPWQADAFVMALTLSHQGYFRWSAWVEQFAQIIRTQPQLANETAENAYYRQWLACLEKMLGKEGLLTFSDILICEEKWRYAYLHTPHGHPVELSLADTMEGDPCAVDSDHHHHHDHDHHHDHGHHDLAAVKPLKVFKAGVAA